MLSDPMVLGALAVAGVLGIVVLDAVIHRSLLGLWLVLATFVITLLDLPIEAQLGPFNVDPDDVVSGMLGVAALARLVRSRQLSGAQALLLVYAGLVAYAVWRGLSPNGLGAAVNEARKFVHYTGVALYVSTFRADDRDLMERAGRALVVTGIVLLGVTLLRWGAFFGGVSLPFSGRPDDLRVIDSFETLILLQALLLAAGALALTRMGRRLDSTSLSPGWFEVLRAFAPAAFLAIVLLQHRTLWGTLLLGAVLLLARDPEVGRRLVRRAAVGAIVVAVVGIAVLGEGQERIVLDELEGSATQADTFSWRIEGWERLVQDQAPADAAEWIVGQEFGGGYPRFVNGRIVNVSPHNFALELFLRLGLLGDLVFIGVHAWLVLRLYVVRRGPALLRSDVLAICLVVAGVYYLTSHPRIEQGLVLGLAIAAATTTSPNATRAPRAEVPSPEPRVSAAVR